MFFRFISLSFLLLFGLSGLCFSVGSMESLRKEDSEVIENLEADGRYEDFRICREFCKNYLSDRLSKKPGDSVLIEKIYNYRVSVYGAIRYPFRLPMIKLVTAIAKNRNQIFLESKINDFNKFFDEHYYFDRRNQLDREDVKNFVGRCRKIFIKEDLLRKEKEDKEQSKTEGSEEIVRKKRRSRRRKITAGLLIGGVIAAVGAFVLGSIFKNYLNKKKKEKKEN